MIKYTLVALLLFTPTNIQAQRIRTSKTLGVYTAKKALKHAQEVRVLDLRGRQLDSIILDRFTNLEVLLLGHKRRNLWFYPKAWKYELGLKGLPGGGYAHLQGRGRGNYYLWNHIHYLPNNLCRFSHLKIIDIYYTEISEGESTQIENKLKFCNSETIVLRNGLSSYETYLQRKKQAEEYLLRYNITNW